MQLKRYENNPILRPNPNNEWENFCVLNPAVIYDEESKKFIMLYRAAGDTKEHYIQLGLATSEDGFTFQRESDEPCLAVDFNDADGGCIEDPRLVKIDGFYYVTYAGRPFYPGRYWLTLEQYIAENGEPEVFPETAPWFIRKNATATYLAYTKDFKTFKRLGRITDSRYDDRDVVIFPEQVNGKFVRLSRPKFPKEHKLGDIPPSIWISFSDDLMEWDNLTLLMKGEQWWENDRIGASCPPLKTDKGWLFIYHGKCKDDEQYRVGIALLDLQDPSKILARTKDFVLEPKYDYETKGIYNGCVFPTGNVIKDGVLYVYYGCADKYVAVATANVDEILAELLKEKI